MASINLHAEAVASVTCVSNCFIDHYMKDLSGDAVRVYLCLLRCIYDPSMSFAISSTAERLGITARKVRTSLDRLSSAGILALDYDDEGELCDICMKPLSESAKKDEGDGQLSFDFTVKEESSHAVEETPVAEEVSRTEAEESKEPAAEEEPETLPTASYKDMSNDDLENDPEISQILFIAERYLGSALNNSGMDTILYWHIDLGMSEDLIDYLITSTLDAGRRSPGGAINYMNAIAIDWYKHGIHTVEDAMLDRKQHNENVLLVKKAFSLGRPLAKAQMSFVDKWFNDWHFSQEMVVEACNRTMTNISTPNFKYADSILESWHKKGYTDVAQLAGDDAAHTKETKAKFASSGSGKTGYQPKKNGFNSYSEKNKYDSKAIEAMLLKNNTF